MADLVYNCRTFSITVISVYPHIRKRGLVPLTTRRTKIQVKCIEAQSYTDVRRPNTNNVQCYHSIQDGLISSRKGAVRTNVADSYNLYRCFVVLTPRQDANYVILCIPRPRSPCSI